MKKFSKFWSKPTPVLDKLVIPVLLMIYSISYCLGPLERRFQTLAEMQSLGQSLSSAFSLFVIGVILLIGIFPVARIFFVTINQNRGSK